MGTQTLLCLLLVPGIFASPFAWDESRYETDVRFQTQCSTHCTGSNKFGYENGRTYHYKYEVSTITNLNGASGKKGRLDITAYAYIHVLSKCEMALTLSGVSVTRSQPDTPAMRDATTLEFKSDLESYALRFSFQDGLVEEICPSVDEVPYAINFKRGVLTAFQNSMSQHDRPENINEIDVAGNCPTIYSITQRGTRTMQISKSKDLLGCSNRLYYRSSLQSTPFHTPNAIKSLPLLKGSHRCTQTISKTNGHLSQSLCLESLVFRPFSKQESGARTETTQKLEFVKMSSLFNINANGIFRKTSLAFDHTRSKTDMEQLLWATKGKLNDLCRASVEEITADVPGLFADMIYLMRGLDSRDIMDIWERVERGSVCGNNHDRALKFILDSLPIVGTSSSVEVMTEMLLANRVTGMESELWITSFSFIEDPDKFMIKQLKRLLLSKTHKKFALLPVSSLIKNFCHKQTDCSSVTEVVDVISVLNDIIGRNCQNDDEEMLLNALRAVGNLGHADSLVTVLDNCIALSSNSMTTRVLAAQAYRGMTCNVKRDTLMDLFLNRGEDSELRIAGYLGLMQCPDDALLEKIRIALAAEPVNQVGSFVWTHLTNLMETANPHKQALREILEDNKLKREFDMDKRKYSRNYELSYFSEKFGTGAMAESNLIWSSSSFLPRSLMVNLTIDFLGHSVNLLEVGARAQGVEKLVMNYFGSNSVFEKNSKSKTFHNPSRCVKKTKMNDMQQKHGISQNDMSASFYLRMFGNELDFKHFSEKDIMKMKDKLNTKDILASLAKGDKISFSHSAMFLDSTVTVPTVAGMALQLSVNGTSSIDLKAVGKLNLRSLSLNKMNMNFNFRPSGAIQLSGLMTLDAGVTKTGLHVVSTLHSSTAFAGSLDLINGQVLSAHLDTPKDKLEVLDVKSEFFVVHDKAEEKDDMMAKSKGVKMLKDCSPKSLLKAVGYEACAEFSYIDASKNKDGPHFPFTGPASFSLIIDKKDVPTGFKLMAKYINDDKSYTGRISVESPGSQEDRALAVGYFIDKGAKSLEIELQSPWKKLMLKGNYEVSSKKRSMLVSFLNDGSEHSLEIVTKMKEEGGKIIWMPTLRLVRASDSTFFKKMKFIPEKFTVAGLVSFDNKFTEVKAEVNISSSAITHPLQLKGTFINNKIQKAISGSISFDRRKTYAATFQALTTYSGKRLFPSKIQPTILITALKDRLFLLDGAMDYKENKMFKMDMTAKMDTILKNPAKLNVRVTNSNKKNQQFKGNLKFNSDFAIIKSRGVITIPKQDSGKRNQALLTSKIITNYVLPTVKTKSLKRNAIVLNTKITDRSTSSINKYYAVVNLDSKKYPDASFLATMDAAHKSTFTKSILTFKQGPKSKNLKDKNGELKVGATISHKISKRGADIRYDLQTIYPIMKIDYQLKGKHEHHLGKQISFENYNMLVLAKGKTIELRVKGDDKSKKLLEFYGNMELNYPSFKIGERVIEGQNTKLTSIIQQTPDKEYIHTINVQTKEGVKHVMVTTFKKTRNNNFDLKSQVDINGQHQSKLTLTAMKDDSKFDTSLLFQKDSKIYRGQFSTENQGKKYRTLSIDIMYPERRIMTSLEVGLKKGKYSINGHCSWDADKDITQKIEITAQASQNINENDIGAEYGFKVTTPFEGHTIYQLERKLQMSPKIMEEFRLIFGTPDKELSYKYTFITPMTFERFEMMFEIKTPFENLRKFYTEIQHKFDGSKHLSSTATGQYNDHEISTKLTVADRGDVAFNNLVGDLTITSSFDKMKNVAINFNHHDDGRTYTTQVEYERNGEIYRVSLHSTYFRIHWQVKLTSDLKVTLPDGRVTSINLNHDSSLTHLDSTITVKLLDDNEVKVVLTSKFNTAEKDYNYELIYTGTFGNLNSMIVSGHFNNMNGIDYSYFYQVNNDPRLVGKVSFKYTDTEISYEASIRDVEYSWLVQYERYPYTLLIKFSDKSDKPKDMVLQASVDKSRYGWTSDMRLVLPLQELKNIDMKGHLKKKNDIWSLDGLINLDVKEKIDFDFAIDIDKWTQMKGQIVSPFKEFSLMNFGFNRDHGRTTYNSSVFIEIQPVFNMVRISNYVSREPHFYTEMFMALPDLDFKFIKMTADTIEQRRGVKTDVNIKYHPDKEIDLKLKAKYNKAKFPEKSRLSIDFHSPFEFLEKLTLKSDLDKVYEKWVANLKLKTSNKEFESLDTHYEFLQTDTLFDMGYEIKSSLFEPLDAGIYMNWGEVVGANVSFILPNVGRTILGFKRKSNSWLDFQNKIFGELKGHELDIDVGVKHDEANTDAWLTYVYPGAHQSFIKSNIHKHGKTFMDFDVGCYLQVGKTSPEYNASVQFSATETKQAIGATFITPHTMPFSALIDATKKKSENSSKLYLLLGRNYMLDTFERIVMTKSLFEREYKIQYLFDGKGHSFDQLTKVEWSDKGEEFMYTQSYDGDKIQLEGNHKNAKANGNSKETLDIMLFTPYDNFQDVGIHAFMFMDDKKYDGKCTIEYMDDMEADLTFDLALKTANKLTLDASLTLPETDYRINTLKYTQVNRRDKFSGDATLSLGSGEKARTTIEFKKTKEFIITVTGPIKEFEEVKITGKYNRKQQRLNGDLQLKLNLHPKPANLEFDILINNEPITMTFKLQTPYENFKKADLTITHVGKDWKKFKTQSHLTSEAIGKMNSEIFFHYTSENEMEGKATLTSSIENIENLKLGFNTKKQKNEQVNNLELGWGLDKEMTIDSTWNLKRSRESLDFKTNFEITTSFDEIRSASFKLTHLNGERNLKEYIKIIHNGRIFADSTLTYKFDGHHIANLDIRHPRPMAFDLDANFDDQTFDGTMKVNWDKHSPESLFEFVVKMADKSMDSNVDKTLSFKVIHPVRIMGLDGKIKSADKEMFSSGHLTWDERKGKTFSYDVGYSDRSTKYSQMYDGHLKVGVPNRGVKVEASHRDTGTTKSLTSSILWDADKDETKKVVLITTTERQDRMERLSLNLNLPYINKQMNMGISRKIGYGSSILESEAEISYSSDPRKNIIFTTKIDNKEMDLDNIGNYNYTIDIGFVHRITGIDIQWESHLGKVDEISSTGSRITYLTAENHKKVMAFLAQVDSDEQKGEMMIITPLKTVAIEGDIDNDKPHQSVKFITKEDGTEALRIEMTRDPRRRKIDMEIHYDRDNANKMLSISGNYVNDSAIQINVVSQDNSVRKSDSQIALRLNSSDILHTRIQWRPNLLSEIQTYLGNEAAVFSHTARDAFSQTLNAIGNEVKNKYARTSQELREETTQVFELMEKEMDRFSTQLESLRTAYRRFYQRNDLNIQALDKTLREAFADLSTTIQILVKQYRAYYTGITKATNKWLNDLRTYPIMQKYLAASNELINALTKSRLIIEEGFEDLSEGLQAFSDTSYEMYSRLRRKIDRKLNSYSRMVHELPLYKQMLAQRQFLPNSVTQKVPEWLQKYEKLFMGFQEMLQDQYDDLMSRKEFRELYAVAAEVHQQFMYYNLEQNLKAALERVFSLSKNLVLMEIVKMKDAFLNMQKSRLIVYDPEQGELQFEIHLPVEMKSLTEPPKLKMKMFSKLHTWAMSKVPKANDSIWDSYYKYVPSLQPSDWLPPFQASGYILGSQHILTFDKAHYDFYSTCSHVLARDMLNDDFSVVLNYNRNQRNRKIRSICVHFEDSLSLEISDQYQLTVNNKEAEMPFYSNIVSVIREGDMVTIKYTGGVMVMSNPRLDLYKVTLSGWYHGRTAGLLGVYDNEKNDDEVLAKMTKDFEVNRRTCRSSNNLALIPDHKNDKDNICVTLFEDNSSKFRPCFKQVDQSQFLSICHEYMANTSPEEAIHKVTEQYRFVCRDQGVYLGPLKEYVPCNKEKPFIVDGKDPLYHSADVLFIVEDNKCNQWATSSLGSIVTEINKVLNRADMKNNRFGLLGLKGMVSTVRTMNGLHFGPASAFLRALETLKYDEHDSSIQLSAAVRMAMKYPFRPGVAKVLIVAPCSTCEVGFMERNLDSVLKNSGFHVHILKQEASSLNDIDQTLKAQDVSNQLPSIGVTYFNNPNDYCDKLALTTNGSIFDTIYLKEGKGSIQRKFIKDFAQKVGWNTKLPSCQKCYCNMETGLSECQLCDTSSIFSYLPTKTSSLPEVIGRYHDFKHDMMSYVTK